jgi:hypothetical protein
VRACDLRPFGRSAPLSAQRACRHFASTTRCLKRGTEMGRGVQLYLICTDNICRGGKASKKFFDRRQRLRIFIA